MYWNEDENEADVPLPNDIIDLQFAIEGRRLPVDHCAALGAAIAKILPEEEIRASVGVHAIHVAGSQNGWERPPHAQDEFLMLSRRTKLILRVPKAHAPVIKQSISGQRLEIDGCELSIGAAKERPLSKETTLFARHVIDPTGHDEDAFLDWAVAELKGRNVRVRKALCGKALRLATPQGPLLTRSLLLANLDVREAIDLQRLGLGPGRGMGCGLFIPHKGIDAVRPSPSTP